MNKGTSQYEGRSVFLSLVVFCILILNWDLFHVGIVIVFRLLSNFRQNQYRYDHLFAHQGRLHLETRV